ncbi:uncharacterized protein LOC124355244 [Homalodisca vitripennis]|uniref:uncharacterized protein LOC124355244 n=1 Tax=Homalodisca vitripennis TaxID=197043 RepID=UPI001EEB3CA2|nr:uncharacterized protein LOC124355244 [Homalodisca vitripennis]
MSPRLVSAILVMVAVGAVAFPFADPDPAKLRRIPRIYNALITSEEQLLPSQAYPAVAPVLRPAALTPYGPYGLPPVQEQYQLYAPDPYSPQSYSRLPGFNDTLVDPDAPQKSPVCTSLQFTTSADDPSDYGSNKE